MGNFIFIAVALGLIGGTGVGYSLSKIIFSKLSQRSDNPRLIVACSMAGALLMLLPSFFISFTVGGNIGGSVGAAVTEIDWAAVPLGLAVGIALFLGCGLAFGAFFGGLVGMGLTYVLPKHL